MADWKKRGIAGTEYKDLAVHLPKTLLTNRHLNTQNVWKEIYPGVDMPEPPVQVSNISPTDAYMSSK